MFSKIDYELNASSIRLKLKFVEDLVSILYNRFLFPN